MYFENGELIIGPITLVISIASGWFTWVVLDMIFK